MIFSTNCNSNAIIKTLLDSSAVGVRMTNPSCVILRNEVTKDPVTVTLNMTRGELQSLRMEAFSMCGGKALATDGVEVGFGAVTGVFVEAVSRINFF